MKILSVVISSGSLIFGILIFLYYRITSGLEGLNGVAWILNIVGSPTTMLSRIFFKLNMFEGLYQNILIIFIFYLVQYQIIAFVFYKLSENNRILSSKGLTVLGLIFIFLLTSGIINWKITFG